MLLIVEGRYNPEVISAIQRFRAEIYSADGVTVSNETDEASYHVVIYVEGHLAGCLRYTRLGDGVARIGGWCVSSKFRATRVALDLALAPFRLAAQLGDTVGICTATTRHGSAKILRRLGGKVIATYYDSTYGCEMQRLEFALADAPALAA